MTDAISESNPRIIDDTRARKLANDLKRCSYYETCATYGLNVERVFQDACQRIVQMRYPSAPSGVPAGVGVPSTPNHSQRSFYVSQTSNSGGKPGDTHSLGSQSTSSSGTLVTTGAPPPPLKDKDVRDGSGGKITGDTRSNEKKKDKQGSVPHQPQQGGGVNLIPPSSSSPSMVPPQVPMAPPPQTVSQKSASLPPQSSLPQLLDQADAQVPNSSEKSLNCQTKNGEWLAVAPLQAEGAPLTVAKPMKNAALAELVIRNCIGRAKAYDKLLMEEERLVTCTPLALRKNKKASSVQKSNSFSGASELRAAVQGHPNANFLAWKNKQFFKPNFLSEKLSRYLSELHRTSSSSSSSSSPHIYHGSAYYNSGMESLTLATSAAAAPVSNGNKALSPVIARLHRVRSSLSLEKPPDGSSKDLPTPSSTPTQSRKNRRRSNLFNPKSKEEEKKQAADGEKVGSGRTIPLKQGYLYKKSNGLNKEWKKKYCTLSDDGRLVYHSSLHDYMEDSHAKEIPLVRTTVKIPGMRPRGSRAVSSSGAPNGEMNNSMGFDVPADGQIDNSLIIPNSSITPVIPDQPRTRPERSPMLPKLGINSSSRDTPNVKKRHRRAKSGGVKNSNPGDGDDSDGYEFVIVSLENKQWHFEAQNGEDRDNWVDAIEQQILSSLQANDIGKNKKQNNSDLAGIQAIRSTRGNNACADCGSPSPDWASINLGALVCIECSGIHRNLGTHISRVRSLDLDDWPSDIVKVMTAVGNQTVNSVWEANLKGRHKPTQSSNRDEKEKWIRTKYDVKEFLPPLPYIDIPVNQQLIDALVREDIRNIIIILGHAEPEDINAPYSKDDGRTALHIAAALGNVVFVQLLLWYNANVRVVDHEGRNALWYARSSGSSECTELLTTSGCPEHPTLPRRRGSLQHQQQQQQQQQGGGVGGKGDVFDKLPSSVI
ncbi:hypothetical protein RRG08_041807 [Elysia crispata]|uniref:Arf-GAP with GTPase, ANK repeat and PH domain-containing protein 2 n=1 Tax=Elysia crispata TaxID=231223 RepID=A0AAE0YV35_9GAST|nr:hypothetical protein RRG08_041807 [Elysia crispata]